MVEKKNKKIVSHKYKIWNDKYLHLYKKLLISYLFRLSRLIRKKEESERVQFNLFADNLWAIVEEEEEEEKKLEN
jgi:hypothetical protein